MTNPSRISTFIGVAVLAAAAIPATGLASGQAANQSRCTASTAGAAIGAPHPVGQAAVPHPPHQHRADGVVTAEQVAAADHE